MLAYAVILGQVSQIYFKNLTHGSIGMIIWGFAGIGMSARNYYLAQEKTLKIAK